MQGPLPKPTGAAINQSGVCGAYCYSNSLRPYLELLRPANVATSFADVLAGFAVAGAYSPWLLLSTACLYAGGIVLNDYFDRDIDAVERPERPIPSGRVSEMQAMQLGAGLLLLGIVLAAFSGVMGLAVAIGIACSVVLYNSWGKHPLNMGICRGLNLLLGMSAAPAALGEHWMLGGFAVFYIAAVTAISKGEVHGGSRVVAGISLATVSVVTTGLAIIAVARSAWTALPIAGFLAFRVIPAFWNAFDDPKPSLIRTAVKTGVLSLVLLDAVIGTAYGGLRYGLIILATALLAGQLSRRFAVT